MNIIKSHQMKSFFKKILFSMSIVVVFITTYMLILPAITLSEPICGKEEHIHIENECFKEEVSFICDIHKHNEECLLNNCELEEDESHIHNEECYKSEIIYSCLLEEHTHDDECYAKADEETKEDWENSISHITLTDHYQKDLLAIAQSQIGYKESTKNTITLDDGTIKGYTRYGAYLDQPYEDWSSLFVKFCLDYANIEFAFNENYDEWIQLLKDNDQYYEDNIPKVSDLIFIDEDLDELIEHVGIIKEYHYKDNSINVIIGDYDNEVKDVNYLLNDEKIIGYGSIPINSNELNEEEINEINTVIDLINNLDSSSSDDIDDVNHQYQSLNDQQKEYIYNHQKLLDLTMTNQENTNEDYRIIIECIDESESQYYGNNEHYYQIIKAYSQELLVNQGVAYHLYENDILLGEYEVNENGIFVLKTGQRAEFILTDIGQYVVRELVEQSINHYQTIKIDDQDVLTQESKVIEDKTYDIYESTIKNIEENIKTIVNHVIDMTKLNTLHITMQETEMTDQEYKVFVLFDDQSLNDHHTYKIIDQDKEILKNFIVEDHKSYMLLKVGQTALIENIVIDTKYRIYEESSEGYLITYSDEQGNLLSVNNEEDMTFVEDVIKQKETQITINNEEVSTVLTLPIYKEFTLYDGVERTFEFIAEQVSDSYASESLGIIQSTLMNYHEVKTTSLMIPYRYHDIESGQYYYKIYENNNDLDCIIYDQNYYIIEVTITKDSSNDSLTAVITNCWKNRNIENEGIITDLNDLTFTNQLVSYLSISKYVVGKELDYTQFDFEIILTNPDDTPLTGIYQAQLFKDGNVENMTVTFDEQGKASIQLSSNETIKIQDLPYMTKWSIKEVALDDYVVVYNNQNGVIDTSATDCVNGTIDPSIESLIIVENYVKYELPVTGGMGSYLCAIGGISLLFIAFFQMNKRKINY